MHSKISQGVRPNLEWIPPRYAAYKPLIAAAFRTPHERLRFCIGVPLLGGSAKPMAALKLPPMQSFPSFKSAMSSGVLLDLSVNMAPMMVTPREPMSVGSSQLLTPCPGSETPGNVSFTPSMSSTFSVTPEPPLID